LRRRCSHRRRRRRDLHREHERFTGQAIVDGVGTTFQIDVDDLDDPGAGQDTFKIQTGSGYTAEGVLTAGNIQVRP
jgi:hypothetical protein